MIGKIVLGVLLTLLALLLVLLQIPVSVRFSYQNGAPEAALRYGPLRISLFPGKKPEEPVGDRPEKKKKPKEKPEKKPKPKKKRGKINREQILYALETLPQILGRALRRTGRSIRIRPLKVYVLAAGYDPADTALLYGRLEAALHGGLPLLRQAVRISEEDVRLYLDFTERQMDVIADVGVSLRPGSLVWVGLRAAASLVKWFLGFRKLASPPDQEDKSQEKETTKKTEHTAA